MQVVEVFGLSDFYFCSHSGGASGSARTVRHVDSFEDPQVLAMLCLQD